MASVDCDLPRDIARPASGSPRLQLLGRGSSKNVFLEFVGGRPVAAAQPRREGSEARKALLREAALLESLRPSGLFVNVLYAPKGQFVLTELAEWGSLIDLVTTWTLSAR